MPTAFTPCPACARHVRASAGRCPFCDSVLRSTLRLARPRASILVAATLCSSAALVGSPALAQRPTASPAPTATAAPTARPRVPPRRTPPHRTPPPPPPPIRDEVHPMYGVPDYKEGEVLTHAGRAPSPDDEPR